MTNPESQRVERHDYRLSAELGAEREEITLTFYAPSYEGVRLATAFGEADPESAALRADATFTAIREIMDRAFRSPLWANGRIELRDPDGEIVHEMDAKDRDEQ